jgi:hypothetical protein
MESDEGRLGLIRIADQLGVVPKTLNLHAMTPNDITSIKKKRKR